MEILKQLTKQQWAIGVVGIVVIALVILGVAREVKAPTTESTTPTATSTPSATNTPDTSSVPKTSEGSASKTAPAPFPINPADTIASWTFKGAYAGNATSTAQANADIAKLTNLLGKGAYDDYDLYNGIGNDFDLLGEGKMAYKYYNQAAAVHPTKGLVYTNLGHLMSELGAYNTAADAYAKAVKVEPGMLEYHLMRLTYLTRQFPNDTTRITSALKDASAVFGDTAPVLEIEAEWLTGQGRYADAIKAWQTAKTLSPGADTSAIDAAIARLQAKLSS